MNDTFASSQVIIPDRYEVLARTSGQELNTIIIPVESGLREVDEISRNMRVSSRGAFLIIRGNSGAGKTTFVHSLHIYRQGVETYSLPGGVDIPDYLRTFMAPDDNDMSVIVLEEREAAVSFSDQELESWLHSINSFIRSERGKSCLVIWPCNTDGLMARLTKLALDIGGKSLLGSRSSALVFTGPSNELFPEIAARTLGALNQGAGLSDFGLTSSEVEDLAGVSTTVGDFLGDLRELVLRKQEGVSGLLVREHPKLWIVVVAGNEPEGDVAGLTRGNLSQVDMDRLMSSTEANIVSDLKKMPEKLGVLATVLGAKILHLPVLAATAAVRAHADERLLERLRKEDFALSPKRPAEAKTRILQSEFGSIFAMGAQRTLTRGSKLGDKSVASFEKLAKVASADDAAVNKAIGRALIDAGLIEKFDVEVSLPGNYSVRSDLLVDGKAGRVRVEMMWRSKTGRADIANYTLKKLENYGKAIGLLS